MAASAVMAAILPSKSNNKFDKFSAGSLTYNSKIPNAGSASSITCAPDTFPGQITAGCNVSTAVGSESTADWFSDSTSISSATADGGLGGDNTSDAS